MPELQYWFSGTALFLPISFAITVVIGLVGIKDMISPKWIISLMGLSLIVTLFAWYTAAKQEKQSAELADSIKRIADSANINPDQSTQTLADEIIKRLAPLKEGLETTKKEVDRLAHPPRNPNSLYQYDEPVAEVAGAFVQLGAGIVTFEMIRTAGKADQTKDVEYQDWILHCPNLPSPRPNTFVGTFSVVVRGGICSIIGRRSTK